MMKEIDPDGLRTLLDMGKSLHLLDIRTQEEAAASGRLPRAEHLPMHLLPTSLHQLPRDKDLILYCRSGNRSFHASVFLAQQGFHNVVNLREGILGWARRGYEIETRAAA